MAEHFKVAIIGAGPGGLGAATNAAHHGLSHVLFEKSEIGNTIFDYQLRKHVMDEPGKLPLRSKVGFKAGTREEVLQVWNDALTEHKVNVNKAAVTGLRKVGDKFEIQYGSQMVTADHVVLAIGLQGSPRRLACPGAESEHVAYTLSDPDAFEDQDILVVGAGDAAIENAVALCEKNRVSILNRSDEFARAKDGNIALITKAIESKKIRCFYNSDMSRIEGETAYIETAEKGEVSIKATHIIARIGAIMPRKFLEDCGIEFPNADMNSVPVVDKTYQCNVPGLHIVGALIGYPLIKQAINQGFEVIEHLMGNDIEPADQVLIDERLSHLPGSIADNFEMIRNSVPLFKELS
ncbi:MAG: NAD(P)-binding domain-containing protein, partial [Deltaproteobacteria bacterium]|nr:NAD(P)-binding domain-containing protein [Deltaproteobacteria bacterium]